MYLHLDYHYKDNKMNNSKIKINNYNYLLCRHTHHYTPPIGHTHTLLLSV